MLSKYDVLCVTETKLDKTDVISVPGYEFISQERKQKYIRKSGGIGLFHRDFLKNEINVIETDSDYILWLKFHRRLFNTNEDLILGVLYVPPEQSRFLNEDEYFSLESEITSMSCKSSYICLTGDMNARTSNLCDFVNVDSTIADLMNFDENLLNFFNQSNELPNLNINKDRVSCDKKTNNNGYKLIDICTNNNLFILNGRFGSDKNKGKCTFRDQSLIDYTICSVNVLRLLSNFEIIDTDALLSDGHALLSWSVISSVVAKPKLNRKQTSTYRKWDSRFEQNFLLSIPNNLCDDLCSNLKANKLSIDQVTRQLAETFIEAAKKSFPVNPRKANQHDKQWFGPQCRSARKRYHFARQKYKRFRNSYYRKLLNESSKFYKKTMNFHINKQKMNKTKRLREMHSAKPKDYWRYINSLKTNAQAKMPPLQDFYNFFRDINSLPDAEAYDFDDAEFDINFSDDILNTSISQLEISHAIHGLKTGKSAGHDDVLNEYIKSTEILLMPFYVKLFNIIFDTGILPDTWLEGKIRPIYKNKGDQANPENYRPITVLSCLSKLFTSVLNNRLTKFLDTFDALNENQAGFRKGYSTLDHIFSLNALVELFKSQKKKVYCAFIDFSRAFDSVWRIGLWKKLLESSVNGKMLRLIHNMYEGIKSCISIQGDNSPFFACECGVRQGENLSPLLFALYLNDLEAFLLHKNLSGITIDINDDEFFIYMRLFTLLYADDTALMADSPFELQNCLNAFFSYCKAWKLDINTSKTKIVIFGARKIPNIDFKIGNDIIEIVDKYKYLGVLFSQSGSFLNARKLIVQQAKKAMVLLFTRINNLELPLDLQIKLFDNTVIPILTYASEIWGYENLDIIEKVHNDFLRKITHARKSTPLYMLHGELGRFPLEIIVKTRMIGFWNRLMHGKETKLSFLLYQCLLHSPNQPSKWINHIKSIFIQVGRPDIWLGQQNFQLKSLSSLVKKTLVDQYIQDWFTKGSQSSKAFTYFCFKRTFELEKYFITLPSKMYILFFKMRTANHKLPVETGRWDGTERNDRKCLLCSLNDIGDEFHYICRCPYFDSDRKIYIKPYYFRRPNMHKFCQLMNCQSQIILTHLCKFVEKVFRVVNE